MDSTSAKWVKVAGLALLGIALLGVGVYIAEIDDAPGVALMGFLLMMVCVTAAVKTARKKE